VSGCSIFASRHHPPLLSLDVLGRDEANANILKFEVLAFVAALSVVALFAVAHAAVVLFAVVHAVVAHAVPSLLFLAVPVPAPSVLAVLVLVPLSPGLSPVPSYHVPAVHVLSAHATAAAVALLNVAPFVVLSFGVPSALFVPVPVVEYVAVPSIAAAPSYSAAPLTRVVSDPAAALGDCIATDPEVENLVARLLLVALSPHHMRDLS
jgi:hypothetical protein